MCTYARNFATLVHTRAAHRDMQGFRGLPGRKNSDRFRCATPGLQGVHHRSNLRCQADTKCQPIGEPQVLRRQTDGDITPPVVTCRYHTPLEPTLPKNVSIFWVKLCSLLTSKSGASSDVISTHFCSSVGGSHTLSPSGGCVVELPAEHKCPLNYPLKNKVSVNMSVGMSVGRKITNFGDFHPPASAFPALAESEVFRARVPQFTGKETDYQGWKIQLIGYFRKKGLEQHLTNDTPPESLSKTELNPSPRTGYNARAL